MASKIRKLIRKLKAKDLPFRLRVEKGDRSRVSVLYQDQPCLCPYNIVTFDLKEDSESGRGTYTPKNSREAFVKKEYSSEAVSLISSFEISRNDADGCDQQELS